MANHKYPINAVDDNILQPLDTQESTKLYQESTQNIATDYSIPEVVFSDVASKIVPPEITASDISYHSKKYKCEPSNYYKYTDPENKGDIYYHVRWDLPDGDKQFHPYIFCVEKNKWISKGFPESHPLYNLLELIENPEKPVLIVEGEKTVSAAKKLFPNYVAVTSCGGANAANKTDWSVLKGRNIIIAPDNDDAGIKYAEDVLRLCEKIKDIKSVKFLYSQTLGSYIVENSNIIERKEEIPKGYDLADSLAEGWTSELITKAMADERFISFFVARNIEQTTRGDVTDSRYELRKDGVFYKIEIKEKGEAVNVEWVKLCGYLKATHYIRDNDSNNWALLFELIDQDSKKKKVIIKREQLTADKTILELLLKLGLEIPRIKRFHGSLFTYDLINNYINISKPTTRAIAVDKVGWHGDCYIMPFADDSRNVYFIENVEELKTENKEEYILQSNATNPRNLTRKGTLEGWKHNIGKLAVGNNLLMFSCAAALTAPLLKILGEEGCCFHFTGSSSIGKTTALYVASSIWGMGKPSSFRTTDNAAESLCKNSNDGLLLMDELAEIDPSSLDKIAYLFGNGTGKGRSKKNGDAQLITTFRILGLSTGEIGLQAKLTEKGKTTTAGQSVRFIEIAADSGKGFGVFDTLHEFESGRTLSDYFKKEAENCGIVIDEFMQYIASNFVDVTRLITELNESWLKIYLPEKPDPQVERVAKKFAFVATVGEIAIDAAILPFKKFSISTSCKILFDRWLEQRGGNDSHELQSIIARLKTLTQEGLNSRFLNIDGTDASKNIQKVAGYKKLCDSEIGNLGTGITEFWIYPAVFKREILQDRNEKIFYKQLIASGYISPDTTMNNATQVKRVAKRSTERFVVVPADKILD